MSQTQPLGPFKLVTVNTAPDRARKTIGRMVEAVKDRYTIIHAANVEAIKDVGATVEEVKPDFLFCASMWTPDESAEIQAIAKEKKPDIKTMALPQGLQVARGPDGVFEWLMEKLPAFVES